MKDLVAGGLIVLVLGGTTFAVSQTDIAKNFANETGMSQTEAEKYVEESKDELVSFTEIGTSTLENGRSIMSAAAELDCATYVYDWESPSLSCDTGKTQIYTLGSGEAKLGECYKQLDADLSTEVKNKINECIADIDNSNANHKLPIVVKMYESSAIDETIKANAFNKSVLKAATES